MPAQDPNDPLQWGKWKKMMVLVVVSLYSFLGNTALLGIGVYIPIFSVEFGVTPNKAAGLINYANLAFGFGSLILVPLYHKFGRRPVMLLSMVLYCVGLIGASQSTSYDTLMAFRVIHALGSGVSAWHVECLIATSDERPQVCEALPVQLVNDIFFLHERGTKLGVYTICLCLGSLGPLFAGYMLNGGYSWRLFFYVEFAFAVALLVFAFFVVEETTYHRKPAPALSSDENVARVSSGADGATADKERATAIERAAVPTNGGVTISGDVIPKRKSFAEQLKFWGVWEHDADFFIMMARSFTYFLVPHVFWVVTTYGTLRLTIDPLLRVKRGPGVGGSGLNRSRTNAHMLTDGNTQAYTSASARSPSTSPSPLRSRRHRTTGLLLIQACSR